MSLYPSLEDMKIDQLVNAQQSLWSKPTEPTSPYGQTNVLSQGGYTYPSVQSGYPYPNQVHQNHLSSKVASATGNDALATVYPALKDFMGLELSHEVIAQNMPEYGQMAIAQQQSLISHPSVAPNNLIAPLSSQTLGLQKAQVTHGIRELILCKDKDGKVGIRVKAIDNGIFVALVIDKSPAALAGLRFGDQILQINGTTVAGFTMDKVHTLLKKSPVNGISVVVRDRPFERTITLHKDSGGLVGFQIKNGKIISIVKDSSAARNGVLVEHQLLEVDGQNVIGMKDKEITKIIDGLKGVVTITVIPNFIYDHMVKRMSGSLIKELMDHSVPTL